MYENVDFEQLGSREFATQTAKSLGFPVFNSTLEKHEAAGTGPRIILAHRVGYTPIKLYRMGDVIKWCLKTYPTEQEYVTRQQLPDLFARHGYTFAYKSLAMFAHFQCGPEYIKIGHLTYYRISDALKWAHDRVQKQRKKNPADHLGV